LPIFPFVNPPENRTPQFITLFKATKFSSRIIIRLVCAGLKHYCEAHLHIKAQQIRRAKMGDSGLLISSSLVHNFSAVPGYKV